MSLRTRSVLRLFRTAAWSANTVCQCRFASRLSHPFRSKSSSSFILGQSEVLCQDGIEIQELPWVVRRLDPREFPFNNSKSTADGRRYMCGVKDEHFMQQLQECVSIREVLRLLEVPGEAVTASSAAFALQRLSQLCSATGSDEMDSFIRKAVLNELCETVVQGLSELSNCTVVSLAGDAALASSGYDVEFVRHVNNEVERRVGDSAFSIRELCSLIRLLSLGARGDIQVTRNVWVHIGSRYKEIDAGNIAAAYCAMRYITPDVQYLWRMFEKQLQKCWWKLNGDDVASIASRVAVSGRQSTVMLVALGRWLTTNIASVTDAQLRLLLAAHGDFHVLPGHASFVTSLERYVPARVAKMDRTAVAMVVDFFRRHRWLSTRVLDAVAKDFETNGSLYAPHELVYVLRAYGQLNYMPPNSGQFFTAVEKILLSKFCEFDAVPMLELLVSFVCIERFPVNFLKHVFSPYFLMQIKGNTDATVRQRAIRHFLLLQTAVISEFPYQTSHEVSSDLIMKPQNLSDGRHLKFHNKVGLAILHLVGEGHVNNMRQCMAHFIDFAILVDGENAVVNAATQDKSNLKKLAVLLVMPEYHCVNTPQLLGEYAMKHRQIQKLGYTVVTVDYEKFMHQSRTWPEKLHYIHSLLSPYCKLADGPSLRGPSGSKCTEAPTDSS